MVLRKGGQGVMREPWERGLRGPVKCEQGLFGAIVATGPNFSFVASPSLSEHASRAGIGATGDRHALQRYAGFSELTALSESQRRPNRRALTVRAPPPVHVLK